MTELSFLLELLLEHKLAVATKKTIKDRIKELEARQSRGWDFPVAKTAADLPGARQSASTQALLDKQAAPDPAAQSPVVQAALAQRAQLLQAATTPGATGTVTTGKGLQGKRKF